MRSLVGRGRSRQGWAGGEWGIAAALTSVFGGLLVVGEHACERRCLHAHRHFLRSDGHARTYALQTVHYDELARLQPFAHDAQAIRNDRAKLHRAILNLVVLTDG